MCSHDEVLAAARRMVELGLVTETFGNVSCRLGEHVLITPTRLDYGGMTPNDLVLLDRYGTVLEGHRAPSSEYRLHLAIYRRFSEVGAVVHTHSPCAVEISCGWSELPVGGSNQDRALRGPVPVAPFRPAGTQDLADQAAGLLASTRRNAVLLARHGVVGIGRDVAEALSVCEQVEQFARDALSGTRLTRSDGRRNESG
jgi:L-ribulose-5-phosphate 4-epimerase